jgi:hypothetical protein
MKQSILLIALALILTMGCNRRVQKATLYRASGLNQSVSTSEAYYANLKLLDEYSQEIEDRCQNFPDMAAVFHNDAGSLREAMKRQTAAIPQFQNDANYWKLSNDVLIALDAGLRQLDEVLSDLEAPRQ